MRLTSIALLIILKGVFALGKPPGDPIRGQQLYESRCTGCHSVETNRAGPKHFGIFGRKAGQLSDYEYSKALKSAGFKWTENTLERWLKNPTIFVPNSKMGFSVPEQKDRLDIIAYLKTLK